MSTTWVSHPLRSPILVHSRTLPLCRSSVQVHTVHLPGVASNFIGHGSYSMRSIGRWRKIDYRHFPSCNTHPTKFRGKIAFATDETAAQANEANPLDQGGSSTDEILFSNAQPIPSKVNETNSNQAANVSKRGPLTAREKLRAARVLGRYTESKPSKPQTGSRVLDASRASDKGKRAGLPEAPVDLFDDGKRGMPKPGWTFDFPGGSDLLIIAFSFVFISTVMFATTYIVWKVGAIHYDEF